jgi:hypothetical protein
VLPKQPFTKAMLEKLVWISGVMLVGQKHKANVGATARGRAPSAAGLPAPAAAHAAALLNASASIGPALPQVGAVESQHKEEVSKLFAELAAAGSKELGVQLDAGVVERLNAYSRSVAHFPTAVKEFQWRNGWFYAISQRAAAAGQADPMPMHTALLKEVGAA